MKAQELLSVVFGLLLASQAWGQDSLGIAKIRDVFTGVGKITSIACSGNRAFAVNASGFDEIDISDDVPRYVSSYYHLHPKVITASESVLALVSDSLYHTVVNLASPDDCGRIIGRVVARHVDNYRVTDAAILDSLLLVCYGRGIQVFNIRRPEAPRLFRTFEFEAAKYYLTSFGNLVYARGSGFYCIDFSNPDSLQIICSSAQSCYGLDANSEFLALSQGTTIRLYDNRDPRHPRYMGIYNPENSEVMHTNLKFIGEALYSVGDNQVFYAFKVNYYYGYATYRGGTHFTGVGRDLALHNGKFYLAFSEQYGASGIYTISVENPERPRVLGTLSNYGGRYPDIDLIDGHGLLKRFGSTRITLLDLSNPRRPIMRGSIPGYASFTVHDGIAYGCDINQINSYDLGDPDNPVRIGAGGRGSGYIVARDTLLYGYQGMIRVNDISDPAAIEFVSEINIDNNSPVGLYVADSLLFACGISTLRILSLADPDSPRVIASIEELRDLTTFAVKDSLLFGTHNSQISCYNIIDPRNPVEVNSFYTEVGGFIEDMELEEDLLFISSNYSSNYSHRSRLDVFDVSDPTNPMPVGHYFDKYFPIGKFTISDNYLLALDTARVGVFDISQLFDRNSAPNFHNAPDTITAVEGDRIEFELTAFDLGGDPIELFFVGDSLPMGASFEDLGEGRGVFAWQTDTEMAGNYSIGFEVNDGELTDFVNISITIEEFNSVPPSSFSPFTFHLSPPYPNPFNSSVTISFSVPPGSGEAGLRVYDLQGRLVKELVNGRLEAGEHKVVWEARDLGSGVCLIQLSQGNVNGSTVKALLIK